MWLLVLLLQSIWFSCLFEVLAQLCLRKKSIGFFFSLYRFGISKHMKSIRRCKSSKVLARDIHKITTRTGSSQRSSNYYYYYSAAHILAPNRIDTRPNNHIAYAAASMIFHVSSGECSVRQNRQRQSERTNRHEFKNTQIYECIFSGGHWPVSEKMYIYARIHHKIFKNTHRTHLRFLWTYVLFTRACVRIESSLRSRKNRM